MIDMLFSPLMQLNIIMDDLVRKCVKLSPFSKTIFILDLDLSEPEFHDDLVYKFRKIIGT